jgi:hypothetical protein
MDRSRVAAIAGRHRAIEAATNARQQATDVDLAERLRHRVEDVWQQLGDECSAFCDTYNQSFGSVRLYCQRHADTVVVRSADDPQETVTLTRTSLANPHGSHIAAHRYSSHAAPLDLALEGHVDHDTFLLTAGQRPVTPTDAVLLLLERFTDELATGQPAATPE